MTDAVTGWDLGGAHLKAARLTARGAVERVVQLPCPLWQGISHLETGLELARRELGATPVHAVTMTGEMVDLFPDRRTGVLEILRVVQRALGGDRVAFYGGVAGFLDAAAAGAAPHKLASANWRASADLVAHHVETALFVDIGSTTTDLIPAVGGLVAARGADDAGRLVAGELLYTGVVRTPLMAVESRAPFDGEWTPLMAEYFATMADVYRLTGQLPEGADLHPAADAGEKTVEASARRLARMIGRDAGDAPADAWHQLAEWFARSHREQIATACDRLLSRPDLPPDAPVVGGGVGRFLLPDIALSRGRAYREFAALLPAGEAGATGISDCAPAVAVAALLQRAIQ